MNKIYLVNRKNLDVINSDITTGLIAAVTSSHIDVMFSGQAKNVCKNDDLLDKCQPLKEYMILINEIRKNSVSMGFEDAVDTAVTDCIEHNVLKTFLLKHRAEVLDVCITEYNEKSFVDGIREEGQNLLATVVLRLRNGETPEQILASGVDAKTIELAETIK